MSEVELTWDLSELFSSCDDLKISKTMDALIEKTDEIMKKYKGKINILSFTAQNLYNLLEKYESILAQRSSLRLYSHNSYMANTGLPETKALYTKFMEFKSSLSKKLAFLESEIGKLVNKNPQIINEKPLSNYVHYLEKIRRKVPYILTETEEEIILEKEQYGVKALQQLRASWISTQKYKVIVEGEEKIISRSEVYPLFQHPDRETRISVFKSVYGLYEKEEEIYSTVVRNICSNWVKNVKRRQYDSPIHQSLIDNDITQEIIDNLMKIIHNNINIYQKFCQVKAKVLNLPKLGGIDIPAYLPTEKKYTWDEIKKLNHHIYNNFDKSFGEILNDMFKRNHIDASTREGKTDFIYCNPWYLGKSAFILTCYTGLFSDVRTLTHELGHTIHYYLASREQSFLNFMPGMIMTEIATFFGELLLADHLLETTESANEKIAVLTNQLGIAGSAIFHMSARMWCEQKLYDAIEKGEYLDGETISKYWCAARDKIYGDSVEWSDEMKWEWVNFSYYCIPDFRFYNYPYAFGQLFVYALFQTYKKDGEKFVPNFKKLLRAGCSMSPEELGKIVGLDITTPEVWNLGMKQYGVYLNKLEKLTN